jgi:hypothetical protein
MPRFRRRPRPSSSIQDRFARTSTSTRMSTSMKRIIFDLFPYTLYPKPYTIYFWPYALRLNLVACTMISSIFQLGSWYFGLQKIMSSEILAEVGYSKNLFMLAIRWNNIGETKWEGGRRICWSPLVSSSWLLLPAFYSFTKPRRPGSSRLCTGEYPNRRRARSLSFTHARATPYPTGADILAEDAGRGEWRSAWRSRCASENVAYDS